LCPSPCALERWNSSASVAALAVSVLCSTVCHVPNTTPLTKRRLETWELCTLYVESDTPEPANVLWHTPCASMCVTNLGPSPL